ncbi:MAG: metallophosphoesterase family protein [Chloroflexota bacterium]
MTKLAILSDIHGNLPALQAVIADLSSVDQVVVAGDIINWGPFSADVVELLAHLRCSVIRGNNEYYLLDYESARMPAHWESYTLIPWLRDQLQGTYAAQIACWPDQLHLRFPDAPPICVVHGIPGNPWQSIYPSLNEEGVREVLKETEESTIIAGHSHIPMARRVEQWQIFNPGSVGVPLDGVPFRARYMLLDGDEKGWRAAFRTVDYDPTTLFEEFERQDFVGQCGPTARLVLAEFREARLTVHPYIRWVEDTYSGAEMTDGLVDEFLQIDTTPYLDEPYRLLRPK